jgi:mono/diheme cytochrome c family protein
MKNFIISSFFLCCLSMVLFMQCTQKPAENTTTTTEVAKPANGGFESQVKWGENLVLAGGCNDCHTPKKMGPHGPELDSSLWLSGHPAKMPPPDVNRKEMESKGLAVTQTMTCWVGPWGISYAANLTSDATGIGNWTEENFIRALREGKSKGIESARTLLPPMPWQWFKYLSDDEIKAIFAYLKTTRPVENLVPQPQPPVLPPPTASK